MSKQLFHHEGNCACGKCFSAEINSIELGPNIFQITIASTGTTEFDAHHGALSMLIALAMQRIAEEEGKEVSVDAPNDPFGIDSFIESTRPYKK